MICAVKDGGVMGMTPLAPALGSQKQEDGYNLATNLAYIASCRLAEATE